MTAGRRAGGRRWAALCLALGLAGCGPGDPEAAREASAGPDPPKSAVLVTIDTLRADALGAYGSPRAATPHLDRLAREGLVFEQAHAASPNTLPSHATLLTGRYPFEHGVRSNAGYALPEEAVTLAERAAEAGFATGAEVAAPVLRRATGIGQGFAEFRDTDSPGVSLHSVMYRGPDGKARSVPLETRRADEITDRGIAFLERHAGRPFLLWLHYFDPHFPYVPPDRFAGGRGVPRWPEEPADADALWEARRTLYAGEVSFVDEQLGRLLAALEELGLAQATLLVVTGDHGEGLGEHGEASHSYFVHQTTMRVPLLLRGAGIPAGRRVERPVAATAVAPTLLAWLGVDPVPAHAVPLPMSDSEAKIGPVYGESIELHRVFGAPVLRFLRQGRWKYVDKPRPELFDLEGDPAEQRDLAAGEAGTVERLRERLAAMLADAEGAPEAAVGIDPATRERLEALGYAAGGGPQRPPSEALASSEAPDPRELVDDVDRITRVGGGVPRGGGDEEDLAVLRDLGRRYPQSAPIQEKLLAVQLGLDRTDEAVPTLRRLAELRPDDPEAWADLGKLLLELGRPDDARSVLAETLERFPCLQSSRIELANLHARASAHAERVALLEAGLRGCDPTPQLLNDLGYALATAPDPSLRDGERAVKLTRRAVDAVGDDPLMLDSLAAALAEVGRFEEAEETARRALRLARARPLPAPVIALLEDHLQTVEAGEPIRE